VQAGFFTELRYALVINDYHSMIIVQVFLILFLKYLKD